jgi:hypothetical protein
LKSEAFPELREAEEKRLTFSGAESKKALKRMRSRNSTGGQSTAARETIFHREHERHRMRDKMPPMYLTLIDIRSRSSRKAGDGISYRHGSYRTGNGG